MSRLMRLLMVPVFIIALAACSEEDVELDPGAGDAGVDESEDEAEEAEEDEND